MPSHYAHYRFGTAILTTLPADVRRSIQRFRRLFDVGLHGPDIFYYYRPFGKNATDALGIQYHEQNGRSFFTRICRSIRMERNEAASAYLYGVLCHYVLDSVLHPWILQAAHDAGVSHAALETEFDRYLLEMDDKLPPDAKKLTAHLVLTEGECDTVARFYPPLSQKQLKQALAAHVRTTRLLLHTDPLRRGMVETGMKILSKELQDLLLKPTPNEACAHLNGEMMAQYETAMAVFPEYLQQMQAHMTYNAPLEEKFSPPFA